MRKLMVAGIALAGAGALAGMSLAGQEGIGEPREVAKPVVAKPVTGAPRGAGAQRGGGGGPTIDFFYAEDAVIPPDNGADKVQPIRCPRGAGKPIGGGARTAQGIVVAYLSHVNPETGYAPPRTYYVGVEDVDVEPDTNPGAGALIEVQCAKGMRVKP